MCKKKRRSIRTGMHTPTHPPTHPHTQTHTHTPPGTHSHQHTHTHSHTKHSTCGDQKRPFRLSIPIVWKKLSIYLHSNRIKEPHKHRLAARHKYCLLARHKGCLLGWIDEVSDEVSTFGLLLDSCEHHLCTGNVLGWVLQVWPQRFPAPGDSLLHISRRIRVSVGLSGFPSDESVQVGSDLMFTPGLNGVTLRTLLFEDLCSLGCISVGDGFSSSFLFTHFFVVWGDESEFLYIS